MAIQYDTLPGIDPRTGEKTNYRFLSKRLDDIGRKHQGKKIEDLYSLQWLLNRFTAAFRGIRQVDDAFGVHLRFLAETIRSNQELLILCGVPPNRRLLDKVVPSPRGYTFCLVADGYPEGFNWFWFKSDTQEPDLPVDWDKRFEERIWPKEKKSRI